MLVSHMVQYFLLESSRTLKRKEISFLNDVISLSLPPPLFPFSPSLSYFYCLTTSRGLQQGVFVTSDSNCKELIYVIRVNSQDNQT